MRDSKQISKIRYTLILWCLILLLVSCGSKIQPIVLKNIPIAVSSLNSEEVNLEIVLKSVEEITQERLPGAYFGGLVYSGKCQDLPNKQGRIVIKFIQVNHFFPFTKQFLLATASINTNEQLMTYDILDYSEFGLNTKGLPIVTHQQFDKVVTLASQQIIELGLSDCDVTITQALEFWIVRCGHLDDMIQKCRFTIDVTTGEIKQEDTH